VGSGLHTGSILHSSNDLATYVLVFSLNFQGVKYLGVHKNFNLFRYCSRHSVVHIYFSLKRLQQIRKIGSKKIKSFPSFRNSFVDNIAEKCDTFYSTY